MSLVGPRPVIAAELPLYGSLADVYLSVRPGLTGLWQVSGRSALTFDRRAMLDCQYVLGWSLSADLVILIRTIPVVLSRLGAC